MAKAGHNLRTAFSSSALKKATVLSPRQMASSTNDRGRVRNMDWQNGV
jgi:hypothetical protein